MTLSDLEQPSGDHYMLIHAVCYVWCELRQIHPYCQRQKCKPWSLVFLVKLYGLWETTRAIYATTELLINYYAHVVASKLKTTKIVINRAAWYTGIHFF